MTDLSDQSAPPPSPLPRIADDLTTDDLRDALKAGLADFRRAPQFGLFFSAVYVLGGLVILSLGAGQFVLVLAATLGFPLAAPFAAVGLYEVSRRIESGQALDWPGVLGVIWAERGRQMPWMGAIIVIYFLSWILIARLIFALILGPSASVSLSSGFELFASAEGIAVIFIGMIAGAAIAFLLFAMTVVSLPLLLDKEVDFVSAMLVSIQMVRENLKVMATWALVIAVATLVALLPWFLGLFLALPVLGHATWHLYRRALIHD